MVAGQIMTEGCGLPIQANPNIKANVSVSNAHKTTMYSLYCLKNVMLLEINWNLKSAIIRCGGMLYNTFNPSSQKPGLLREFLSPSICLIQFLRN